VESLLEVYRVFLVEERGLAVSTAGSYLSVAQQFVSHWGASDQRDLSALSAAQVSEFVLASCQERNVGSASCEERNVGLASCQERNVGLATNLVVGLRALLHYLHLAGITATGLAGAVPPAVCWPATTLPRPISPGDARGCCTPATEGPR
jgi:integrase/recombinase XerD